VWSLEEEANKIKDESYGASDSKDSKSKSGKSSKSNKSSKSSSKYSYNSCAREGDDAAVTQIEKGCLEDDSSQCIELGTAAAEHVVMDNFCTPGSTHDATNNPISSQYQSDESPPNYKEECKKAASSTCEGQIPICRVNTRGKWTKWLVVVAMNLCSWRSKIPMLACQEIVMTCVLKEETS